MLTLVRIWFTLCILTDVGTFIFHRGNLLSWYICRIFFDDESCDEDLAYDELVVAYKKLNDKNTDICKQLEEQKNITYQLEKEKSGHLAKVSELNNEVTLLSSQLSHVMKQVKMMTTGTEVLDEILEGKIKGKPNGIGFSFKHLNQNQQNKTFAQTLVNYGMFKMKKPVRNIKFVASTGTNDPTKSKQMLEHLEEHPSSKVDKASRSRMCHYCKKKGHIRPFCYKLYGFPQQHHQKTQKPEVINVKKVWKPKVDNVGLMAHISLRTPSREGWYFDSGCSRHMTGFKKLLDVEKSCTNSCVTFGNGTKGKILGTGNLINDESPKLDNVLWVRGLTSNLISISQLREQGMNVNFKNSECLVTNENGEVLMRGIKTIEKCYEWVP